MSSKLKLPLKEAVRRRLRTGTDYELAADRLSQAFDDFGPAEPVLRALSMEVLLKALLLAEGANPNIGHDLRKGWVNLALPTQQKVVAFARERFAGHIDLTDIQKIMLNSAKAFVEYRYDYEKNEGRTLGEIEKLIPERDETDFQFHPTELQGLSHGIRLVLEAWLESQEITQTL